MQNNASKKASKGGEDATEAGRWLVLVVVIAKSKQWQRADLRSLMRPQRPARWVSPLEYSHTPGYKLFGNSPGVTKLLTGSSPALRATSGAGTPAEKRLV